MSRQIQIRRGTAAEHENFTGAVGEITMDTTNNTIRVHDGATPGGTPLAKQSEIPTVPTMPTFQDFMPDYTLGTTKAANTTHTATSNGWVLFYEFNAVDRYCYINDVQIHLGAGNGSPQYSGSSLMLPVAQGDTFRGANEVTFFPCINA